MPHLALDYIFHVLPGAASACTEISGNDATKLLDEFKNQIVWTHTDNRNSLSLLYVPNPNHSLGF